LRRSDDDRAGIRCEALESIRSGLRMIGPADRNRMTVGIQPLNLVEGQVWSGGDDERIIFQARSIVQFDAVLSWMNPLRADRSEGDLLAGEYRLEIDLDGIGRAPSDRNPGV
jgi:hypothetical protein